MKNYFEKLERKVQKYKTKYVNHPRKAAFKLALWNLCCVFKKLTYINDNCEKVELQNAPSLPPPLFLITHGAKL